MISYESDGWTEEKYAELVYFLEISRNSGMQRGRAIMLQEIVCQFTCYWHTMIYNHMTLQKSNCVTVL